MKTTSTIVGLAIIVAAASNSFGEDKVRGVKAEKPVPAEKPKKAPAEVYPQDKAHRITGSYIKQDIHRTGMITDGSSQLLVLDNDAIRESGAADLKQLLIRKGIR